MHTNDISAYCDSHMHHDLYFSIFKCLIGIGGSTHPLALLPRFIQMQATQTFDIIIKFEEFSEIRVYLLRNFSLDSFLAKQSPVFDS